MEEIEVEDKEEELANPKEKPTFNERAIIYEQPRHEERARDSDKNIHRKRATLDEETNFVERATANNENRNGERATSEDKNNREKRTTQEEPLPLFLFKLHNEIQKLRVACDVRKTHLLKQGKDDKTTEIVGMKIKDVEDELTRIIEKIVEKHPVWLIWGSKVLGVGKYSLAKIMAVADINIAINISKLRRFAGYMPGEKRVKGEKLHFCMPLKVHMWKVGQNLLRAKGSYYRYYLEMKDYYTKRAEKQGLKILSLNRKEKEGEISKAHIHNMALRKMIQLFLAHLWVVWRRAEGLPLTDPYPIAHLGHADYIEPFYDR